MPKILDDCVASSVRDGATKSQAFARCTASLQKAGILKKGTQELTQKGKRRQVQRAAQTRQKKRKKSRGMIEKSMGKLPD